MPAPETFFLRQPWSVTCDSEYEAKALHEGNRKVTSRQGRVVTFHRSTWITVFGPKPPPKRTHQVVPFKG